MREIVILLLVVVLVVLVIGAVNQDQTVDLDYVFGTWENVSVLTLSAIGAGAAAVIGLVIAAMARMRVVADRRKLERELQLVYPRLREAERAAGLPAWNPPVAAPPQPTAPAGAAPSGVEPLPVAAAAAGESSVGDDDAPIEPVPPLAAAQSEAPEAAVEAGPEADAPEAPAEAGAEAAQDVDAVGVRSDDPNAPGSVRSPNGGA